jgi:hypothetical protein
MKIKMLALVALFAAVRVQAEQIKVPTLKVLDERLKNHSKECIDVRPLLEDSGFFEEMAGVEVDSGYLAMRLRGVAIILAARNAFFAGKYEFYKEHGINLTVAARDAGTIAKAQAVQYLRLKLEEDSILMGRLFNFYVEFSSESRNQYYSDVNWLYTVFFKDYPKVLAEELEKFSSK